MKGGAEPTDVVDLVAALGFVYLRHGQPLRAVVLLIVAAQSAPARADVLRALCGAMVAAGMGAEVQPAIERLRALCPGEDAHPMMRLLRARAKLLVGEAEEARRIFRGGDTSLLAEDAA